VHSGYCILQICVSSVDPSAVHSAVQAGAKMVRLSILQYKLELKWSGFKLGMSPTHKKKELYKRKAVFKKYFPQ